jgi:hypothetical protein
MTVLQTRLVDEDRQDVLPPSKSFGRGLLSRGSKDVTLRDAYISQHKTVHVLICNPEEKASSDATVFKDMFGNLDSPFDGVEEVAELVKVSHRDPLRLKLVCGRIELDV